MTAGLDSAPFKKMLIIVVITEGDPDKDLLEISTGAVSLGSLIIEMMVV